MTTTLTDMPDRPLTMAVLMAQLRAEIAASAEFNGNWSAFGRAAGINRTQLQGYLDAQRDMGLDRLMVCIATLGIDPALFFDRAKRRASTSELHRPTDER